MYNYEDWFIKLVFMSYCDVYIMSSIGSYELVLPHLMHLAFSNAVISIFENLLAT